MDEGYSFVWYAGKAPYLIDQAGQRHELVVKDYVPYLKDGPDDYAARATAGTPARLVIHAETNMLPSLPLVEGGSSSSRDPASVDASASQPRAEELAQHGDTEDEDELPLDSPDLAEQAVSLRHLLTHEPKNPHCPTCQRAKMTAKPARRTRRHSGPPPVKFGDLITADHMVMGPQDAGRAG